MDAVFTSHGAALKLIVLQTKDAPAEMLLTQHIASSIVLTYVQCIS